MFTPRRSAGSEEEEDPPPNRSELESKPLPVAFGGSGVGRTFGVGAADEDDLDGALISGTGAVVRSQVGSKSIAPSIVETAAGGTPCGAEDNADAGGGIDTEPSAECEVDGGDACCCMSS